TGCEGCKSALEELRLTSELVRSRRSEAPARLKAKVLAEASPAPAWTAWLKPVAGLFVAAAALVVVIEFKKEAPDILARSSNMIAGAAGNLNEVRLDQQPHEQAKQKKAMMPYAAMDSGSAQNAAAMPAAPPAAPAKTVAQANFAARGALGAAFH